MPAIPYVQVCVSAADDDAGRMAMATAVFPLHGSLIASSARSGD